MCGYVNITFRIPFHTNFRYHDLLPFSSPSELSKISEEFIQYQLLNDADIPCSIWDDARVQDDGDDCHYRMDVFWCYLSSLKGSDGQPSFSRLSKIAKLALVLPHSNAGEERIFSIIRKNKTPFRPNLGIDKTLPSLVTVKFAEELVTYMSHQHVIEKAGKVTWQYSKEHRTNN